MSARTIGWGFAILAVVAGPLLLSSAGVAPMAGVSEPARSGAPAPISHWVGTASCSARACHGGIEASGRAVLRNEYTTWVTQDKHENAYRVLLTDPRSQRMAELLNLGRAHEAERCLACHTTPQTEADVKNHVEPSGVGCESCHGAASAWLEPHTRDDWDKTYEQKKALGLRPSKSLVARAQACVGCHVGSPAADVDHDLIAAGHPRLMFELGAFLDHMPKHWNEAAEKLKIPDLEARLWRIGQATSAEAALELLAARAAPTSKRPWPELAEFDCYACHHELRQPSWRQDEDQKRRQLGQEDLPRPGSLTLSRWYFAMPRLLAARPAPDGDTSLLALFNNLETATRQPPHRPASPHVGESRGPASSPSPLVGEGRGGGAMRQSIARLARQTAERMRPWQEKASETHFSRESIARLFLWLAQDDQHLSQSSWDGAAQLYFALAALHSAYRDELKHAGEKPSAHDDRVQSALAELSQQLAFPFAPARFDSPREYRRNLQFESDLANLLKQLRE